MPAIWHASYDLAVPGNAATPADVTDNHDAQQFELHNDGQVAFLRYERSAKRIVLVHTEVPPELRGRHLGDVLARAAIDRSRAEGLQIVVVCPFVRAYLRKHPQPDAVQPD